MLGAERVRDRARARALVGRAGAEKPMVKACTGRSLSRAIIASTAEESMPPDRNMP